MNTRQLVVLCWSLYGLVAMGVLTMCVMLLTERSYSPEMGRGAARALVVMLLAVLAAAGAAVFWLARSQAAAGLWLMTALLAWPLITVAGRQTVLGLAHWKHDRQQARIGSFADPRLRAMAAAVTADDSATLRTLLAAGPVPAATDRAGLDLVALACLSMAENQTSAGALQALLAAGADPRQARAVDGMPLLHFLILNRYRTPHAAHAFELLLRHGMDAEQIHPATGESALAAAGAHPDLVRLLLDYGAQVDRLGRYGEPPLVRFIGARYWESALLLLEHGARLDIADQQGISVDYYLDQWKDDVHGEVRPEWERVREAIARRR